MSTSLRVQTVAPLWQVQPAPDIETRISPEGKLSLTVTVPLVGPAQAALLTDTVYVAFVCPCVKLPLWLIAIARTAGTGVGTVKGIPLLATPPTVTATFPVDAPAGTDTAMLVALQLVTVAGVPLKVTVQPSWDDPKLLPASVTLVPATPDAGDTLAITGVSLPAVPSTVIDLNSAAMPRSPSATS
jgi:hypothetical protein